MATGNGQVWLKALLTLLISLMLLIATTGAAWMGKKLDKEIFKQHKEHQAEQFEYIKDSLDRIEGIK
jgi:hypothetical protein